MRKRVVVLGATDAGVAAAIEAKQRLADVDVTVVRSTLPCDTREPSGPVMRALHDHGITVMHSAAHSVDPESKSVRFCDGRLIHYDDLIDATASELVGVGPKGSPTRVLRPIPVSTTRS